MSSSKSQAEGVAGGALVSMLVLSNVLGVSFLALGNFLFPNGILVILGVAAVLYFCRGLFSTTGVVGVLLIGFGLLWFNSTGLWESWAVGGKDSDLGSMIGNVLNLNPHGGIHPILEVIHPIVQTNIFTVFWWFFFIIITGLGGYLAYDGYDRW